MEELNESLNRVDELQFELRKNVEKQTILTKQVLVLSIFSCIAMIGTVVLLLSSV